ncbi:receptor-type tyrosine-protein phosphatase U isoform X2 [Hyla sarda]|uniref:receptor-type tyrosine-protein phosphatase U isoform X2 n=1 Tax=Hyla sarda TaxID=327740 RepID=UPI0024C2E824|nr:receptor-type tyrosine-protein phosphatase U isoform X2 [Hyla sarda]
MEKFKMSPQLALLLLVAPLCFPLETETPTAGCTFEAHSDIGPCEVTQSTQDDFDWQLVHDPRGNPDLPQGSYLLVNSSEHSAGKRAHLLFQPLSENDTHCMQFSYLLHSRDARGPGSLRAYVRVNGGPLGTAVWEVSGPRGKQWQQAELAVSNFWPSEYQVLFEAEVSGTPLGFIALDDILLLSYPCAQAPHFSRLGEVEVNAGQNATFLCPAAGRANEGEAFLLQRQNGGITSSGIIQHVSHWRLLASFQLFEAGRDDQDLYRCVSRSIYGAGVSNFAELVVKEPPTPIAPPQLLRAGPTYLVVQLNTRSITGDGPIVRREIEYRVSGGTWRERHAVTSHTYKLWHLDPDSQYHLSVLLTRPGEGGTGRSGPALISRTKCAEPMRAPKGLSCTAEQPRQLTLHWEAVGFNITRCHTYSVTLCYHYESSTLQDCVTIEGGASHYTLQPLPPYSAVHCRLAISNPEGRKEGKEVTCYTQEDAPGGIASESLVLTPLDDAILLSWDEPAEPNGVLTQYEISYQIIESSDPGVSVPGPRSTISKPPNETSHVLNNLHPGTTYLLSVRARNSKGYGQSAITELTTNISAPAFDYRDLPAPIAETDRTITVLLRPAKGRGSPVSFYQVLVEGESSSRARRELAVPGCFPGAGGYEEAEMEGATSYVGAELPPSDLPRDTPFIVGDNRSYGGYWNPPLDPRKGYLIYLQAASHHRGETRLNCVRIARKAPCKDSHRFSMAPQHSEEMGLVLGICAGGLVVFIILLGAVILIVRKGRTQFSYAYYPKPVSLTKSALPVRHENNGAGATRDHTKILDQPKLLQDEAALTFLHNYGSRGEPRVGSVTESSSLLGGSPRRSNGRKGSPYHTGQLHPAVRVADLLQHINQMKVAEGYGFKQEYESFFDWDVSKKKDKSKGRQEPPQNYERHRVRLHPLQAECSSEEINANYIDIRINREGYHRSNHFIATQGPKQDMIYDFWRMVWQEHCSSIVMITKLVEVGRVKCSKYWPDTTETYGDIRITLLNTETLSEYTVRTLALERRGYTARHEVKQFHFLSWPEHGVPFHATGLLAFIRRVKSSTPPDAGPVVVHCSSGAGRTGCYIVLDVMLDMAECEGVVDIYNCVKTLCSRRINMVQTQEQYVFIHDAILEACLCGDTAIPACDFRQTYKEMLQIDTQSNSTHLRDEFQTLNSVTAQLGVEECSVALLPHNRDKNRSMDVLPPDRSLPLLLSAHGEDTSNYINAALTDSYKRSSHVIVTVHPLQNTITDFWRLVYDYGCSSIVMLNQLNQSNSAWPCLQYWPDNGISRYGPMEVQFVSGSVDEDVVTRLFRVQNITRDEHLLVKHFQYLRWSPYRDTPDTKRSFLQLLSLVEQWQEQNREHRTLVHCLNGGGRSGTFCACATLCEMIRCHHVVDVFYAVKSLRNVKPNMVETLDQYRFCYEISLEYLEMHDAR